MNKATQAKLRKENGQILKRLTDAFGDTVVDKILGDIHSKYRDAFASGNEPLALYEEHIAERAKHLMGLEAMSNTMSSIKKPSPAQIKKNLAETKAFRELLGEKFPKKIIEEIRTHIPKGLQQKVDKGEISEVLHMEILVQKCLSLQDLQNALKKEAFLPNAVRRLPSPEKLLQVLEKATVEEYHYEPSKERKTGTFFFTSGKQQFVVKLLDEPREELFASRLLSLGGVKTPDMRVIPQQSSLGKVLFQKLEDFSLNAEESFSVIKPMYYLVMTWEEGVLGEFYQEKKPPKASHFEEIGEMAAIDLFLYNTERFSLIGEPNAHNFFLFEGGSVAIDQRAKLQKSPSQILSIDPFERAQEIALEIIACKKKPSKNAEILFEGLPEGIKKSCAREKALKHLQKGLVKGLIKVSVFTTNDLKKIYDQVHLHGSNVEDVDLEAYQKMLIWLHKAVCEAGF
ncbi:MAG: hypothetical protein KAR79_02755 [Simkaniaceae bacterium]|nr:hypothetical protein [Simkaniaceae bacterium]